MNEHFNGILEMLTNAKGTPPREGLEWSFNADIYDEKRKHPRGMRGTRYGPTLLVIGTGHDFDTKSHVIIHLLTSAEDTFHENVLDKVMMLSNN
jgi:hypothetical protein